MDIRQLLAEPERLELVAQPVVDLKRGMVVGYEALARFRVEPRLTPDKVFAEAARQGLGVELEAMVVRRALELSRSKPANCFFALNVDPSNLLEPLVQAVLAEAGSLAGVVLELTEHRAVEDTKALLLVLDELRQRGAFIAVDDAGSGYSGLRQVLELRPQLLKVDRELVTNVDQDAAKYALIQMLGELAGRLDAWLLAEGVETESELTVLRQLGVPLAQGYFLSRPAPPWAGLSPQAARALASDSPSEKALLVVRRLLEPCQVCSPSQDWPDGNVVVRLDAEGRPVGMRLSSGEETVARTEPELLRVKARSSLSVVSQRAVTRSERTRWDPLVCIDESGHFVGIVRMPRLVSALADCSGVTPLDAVVN